MRTHFLRLLTLIAVAIALIAAAQPAAALPVLAAPMTAENPVVHAVLFYSPTCGHCHKVITEDLPPLAEKYGDQLEVYMINVTLEQGQALYQSALTAFEVPDDRLGVPTLIVGDTVLVGSAEIPEQFPGIIEQGLEQGGIDLPAIPGLPEAFAAQEAQATSEPEPATQPQTSPALLEETSVQDSRPEFVRRFLNDPIANTLAVIVLAGMLISVIYLAMRFINGSETAQGKGLARTWLLILILIGIGVSGYLTYVEASQTQAVCGPVGNCNAVQGSKYATLFGILPVGILGLIGYAAMLLAWVLQFFGPANLRRLAAVALWAMAWFGVLFSIYLTFLEPFVIGATCLWCLTSAIVITLILWLTTSPALAAMQPREPEFG